MNQEQKRKYDRKYRAKHRKKILTYHKKYYREHKKAARNYQISRRSKTRADAQILKIKCLAYYGPEKKVQCSYPKCDIVDSDMLSLDHINNDGANHRKRLSANGSGLYHWLKKNGFPQGFQTLCFNHQWKKELNRRRLL